MPKPQALSFRLLSWILPVSLIITICVCLSTYLIARSVILSEAQKGIEAVTSASAERVRAYFEQRDSDLENIARSPLFRDHYMNVEYGLNQEAQVYRREIEKMLLDISHRTQAYPRLLYLDASGHVVCGVNNDKVISGLARFEAPEYFNSLKNLEPGQRLISAITRVPWRHVPIVFYGSPLFDEAGKFRGALIFSCSLNPVYEFLGEIHLGLSGKSFLTQRLPQSRKPELVNNLLISIIPVSGTPWAVLTAVNRRDFLRQLALVSQMTSFLTFLACAILVLLLTRQVRLLLRPLQTLATAVRAYAAGNLEARVDAAGPAEIATLAESFNSMADRLKARTEDLVRRVRELTSLHRMNDAVLRQIGHSGIGKICLEAAVQGLGFERGILYRVDEERGEILADCSYGMESVGVTEETVHRRRRATLDGDDILAQVARTRAAIIVNDPIQDPRCDQALIAETKTRSFCLAPVIARDRVIAIIGVDNYLSGRPIDVSEVKSLTLFCSAAGIALENALLLDAIVRSETRYRTAVENSPHAVMGLDQNLRVMLWNRRAEVLFGYQPTEAYGRTLDFIFGKKGYQFLKRQVETTGSVRQAEVLGSTRDGRQLDLNVSWTGQDGSHAGVREWFVVIQDETEKKRLQSQLIQAEKMSAVGSLIAGVAHELNNPLAAVTGFAELLKDMPAGPEEKQDLASLHASALRCRDIVQGLLLFVRPGKAVKRRISLNYMVQTALALLEYRLVKTEGIRLEVNLDPGTPQAAGEFQKFQQVVVNLVGNATDALKGRSRPRIVRVRTIKQEDGTIMEIEDTGPGVPLDKRQTIFEPFYTTKPIGLGTGLGLSISLQIMAEFGGSLHCEAGPEGGARFIAYFPTCPLDLLEAESDSILPPPIVGRKILVVDDEPDLVKLMLHLLEEDGLIAVPAVGFDDASRKIREGDFDLILADIDMGTFKGTHLLPVARQLKKKPAWVFVTGDVLNQSLMQELSAIEAPVLSKPFLRTEFLRVVRRSLGQKNLC